MCYRQSECAWVLCLTAILIILLFCNENQVAETSVQRSCEYRMVSEFQRAFVHGCESVVEMHQQCEAFVDCVVF